MTITVDNPSCTESTFVETMMLKVTLLKVVDIVDSVESKFQHQLPVVGMNSNFVAYMTLLTQSDYTSRQPILSTESGFVITIMF